MTALQIICIWGLVGLIVPTVISIIYNQIKYLIIGSYDSSEVYHLAANITVVYIIVSVIIVLVLGALGLVGVGQWINVIIFSVSVIPILLSLIFTAIRQIIGLESKWLHKSFMKRVLCNIDKDDKYKFHLIIHWSKGLVYMVVISITITLVLGALGKW